MKVRYVQMCWSNPFTCESHWSVQREQWALRDTEKHSWPQSSSLKAKCALLRGLTAELVKGITPPVPWPMTHDPQGFWVINLHSLHTGHDMRLDGFKVWYQINSRGSQQRNRGGCADAIIFHSTYQDQCNPLFERVREREGEGEEKLQVFLTHLLQCLVISHLMYRR